MLKKLLLRSEWKVSRRELADALGVHYQTVGYLGRSTDPFPRLGSASASAG